jgi:ribosomal protein L11 methylase PrmA
MDSIALLVAFKNFSKNLLAEQKQSRKGLFL